MKSAILVVDQNCFDKIASKTICQFKLNGKTLLEHLISTCKSLLVEKCLILSDLQLTLISDEKTEFVLLKETDWHQAIPHFRKNELILVLKGNMPLLNTHTLNQLYEKAEVNLVSHLVNEDGKNTGIFCFKNTDEIDFERIANEKDGQIMANESQTLSINDCLELAKAEKLMRIQKNTELMCRGVQIIDPDNTYIGNDVEIEAGSVIYPNVTIMGHSKIGKNCEILSGSYLMNAIIHDEVVIDSSKIADSEVGKGTTIGPYSHLRNHTVISENVRIGNFVEFKNSNFGDGSKCAHLTYIGDSDVGKKVNIGCGVVTVNYDGAHKFRTTIKDGAFIGSNVNLIAPVTVGEKALLAAGSTITEDVGDGAMGIARARQSNKEEFGSKYLNKGK